MRILRTLIGAALLLLPVAAASAADDTSPKITPGEDGTWSFPLLYWSRQYPLHDTGGFNFLAEVISLDSAPPRLDDDQYTLSPFGMGKLRVLELLTPPAGRVPGLGKIKVIEAVGTRGLKPGDRVIVMADREPYEGSYGMIYHKGGCILGIKLPPENDPEFGKADQDTLLGFFRKGCPGLKLMTREERIAWSKADPAGLAHDFLREIEAERLNWTGGSNPPSGDHTDDSAAAPRQPDKRPAEAPLKIETSKKGVWKVPLRYWIRRRPLEDAGSFAFLTKVEGLDSPPAVHEGPPFAHQTATLKVIGRLWKEGGESVQFKKVKFMKVEGADGLRKGDRVIVFAEPAPDGDGCVINFHEGGGSILGIRLPSADDLDFGEDLQNALFDCLRSGSPGLKAMTDEQRRAWLQADPAGVARQFLQELDSGRLKWNADGQ